MKKYLYSLDISLGDKSMPDKFYFLFEIYLKTIGFVLLSSVFSYTVLLLTSSKIIFPEPLLDNYISAQLFSNKLGILLYVLVLGPFLEELVFRLAIIPSFRYVCISVLASLLLVVKSVSNNFQHISDCFLLLLQVVYIFGVNCNTLKVKIILLTVSSVLFGLSHIENFKFLPDVPLIMIPIVILPQLIIGAAIGIVRIRMGFFWGCLMHCLFNLVIIFKI